MSFSLSLINYPQRKLNNIDYSKIIFNIELKNKLDIKTSGEFNILLNTILKGGALKILINMESLEHIESSGIGLIINYTKIIRKKEGDIIFVNVPERIDEIFKLINLQRFIKMFKNMDDAISFFKVYI